jgi:hypothetical protein
MFFIATTLATVRASGRSEYPMLNPTKFAGITGPRLAVFAVTKIVSFGGGVLLLGGGEEGAEASEQAKALARTKRETSSDRCMRNYADGWAQGADAPRSRAMEVANRPDAASIPSEFLLSAI